MKSNLSTKNIPSYLLIFILCFFVYSINDICAAPPIVLEKGIDKYFLGKHLDVYEDKTSKLTIYDILTPKISKKFKPSKNEIPNIGFTQSAYWTRIIVNDTTLKEKEWFIELAFPHFDYVDFYIVRNGVVISEKHYGDKIPFGNRDIKFHNFIFPIVTSHKGSQTVYFRFESAGNLIIPLTLWSTHAFAEMVNKKIFVLGLYFGIMLVMTLYNLFIFIAVKDRSYLFYVLYIMGMTLFQLCYNGLAFEYLWQDNTWWVNRAIAFFICFATFNVLQFTKHFLKTAENIPKLNKVIDVLSIVLAIATILTLFIEYSISIRVGTLLVIITCIVVFTTGTISLNQKYRPARFFMVAWTVFLAGAMLFALKVFGILPSNFVTENSPQIGSALEVILLSLGLADRINEERRQINHYLEKKVKTRTSELQSTMEILEKTNDELILARDSLWGEMELAKKIQTVLLPRETFIPGYEVSTYHKPADEVGGDYYDVINIGNRDWVIIGDVSGHGVPAGLIMMMVQTSIHTTLNQNQNIEPAELLSIVNKTITSNIKLLNEDKYMTITVLATHKDGIFTFSGLHQDIMIYRDESKKVELVETNGTWIGLTEDISSLIKNETLLLNSNDKMLLYSDGITDAWDKESVEGDRNMIDDMFGLNNLQDIFQDLGDNSVDEIKNGILHELEKYNCFDDVTMVVMHKLSNLVFSS